MKPEAKRQEPSDRVDALDEVTVNRSGEVDIDEAAELIEEVVVSDERQESETDELARVTEELAQLTDRHLRTAAEYENFRKRTARERVEMRMRAQADMIGSLLDALDDLARVTDLDVSTSSTADLMTGVELVERNLFKHLENAGLERIGETGEKFDPNHHEAIGSMPAESEEQDHTVGTIFQPGYIFGGILLRPARVQVRMWQGESDTSV